MKRAVALGALLMVAACGSTSTVATVTTPTAASPAPASQAPPSLPALQSPPTGTGSRSPSPAPPANPTVACRTGVSIASMVMLGDESSPFHLVYEVSDPTHPRLVCTIARTSAHLFTADTFEYLRPVSADETDMVLHSIGSGNESVAARFPFDQPYGSWMTDGSEMAYSVQGSTADGFGSTQVWLYSQGHNALLYTYTDGIGDCICRFGLPPQELALSPDGQYLVAGWIAGKGSEPLAVYRISDRTRVVTLGQSFPTAFWDRTGHRLFVDGLFNDQMQTWTPEAGFATLPGSAWSYEPGLSPDASHGVYTAYADTGDTQPRVYVYDLKAQSARLLVDKLRAGIMFVKDGWVWYDEEKTCTSADSCAGSTTPTGSTFAMQLTSNVEQAVTFDAGDSPGEQASGLGWRGLAGDYWPNS